MEGRKMWGGEVFCLGGEQRKGETGAEMNRDLDIRKPDHVP
jgi:hypothetical protein